MWGSKASFNRGISPALGTILLVGIVVIAIGTLTATGAVSLSKSADQLNEDVPADELRSLASLTELLIEGEQNNVEHTFERSVDDSPDVSFTSDTERLTVSVDGSTVADVDLGMYEVRLSESRGVFTAGGVFSVPEANTATVEKHPQWSVTGRNDEHTYTVPLVVLTKPQSYSQTTRGVSLSRTSQTDLYPDRLIPAGHSLTFTVETDYPNAWKEIFTNRLHFDPAEVSVDESTGIVKASTTHSTKSFLHITEYELTLNGT